ncbi:phage regulatory CII family protein [Acidovorax delafieldii]|uniref:phage regulatory CII family protein n=1 Tax=Acidovorax delafieldii TaxID=47920 RepID=UPI003ECD7D34
MRATVAIPRAFAYGEDEALPSTRPDVLVAVGAMLEGRLERVAKSIGMSPSTLQKKVSLFTDTHHLSVSELQMIQHATGCIAPTEVLAAAEGYVCVRVNPAQVGSVAEFLATGAQMFGDLAKAMQEEAGHDRPVTPNGHKRVQHMVQELMGHINAGNAFVAGRVPAKGGV